MCKLSCEKTPCGLSQPGTTQAWTIHTVFLHELAVHVRALLWRHVLVGREGHGDLAVTRLHADVRVAVPVVVRPDEARRAPCFPNDSYMIPTTGALSATLA